MKTFRRVGARAGAQGRQPAGPSLLRPGSAGRRARRYVLVLALLIGLAGCGVYSFSGVAIPEEYQTVAIVPIDDETAAGVENLDGELTDLLTERFVERTRLRLETDENVADLVLSGRITGYEENRPVAVSGDEVATRNEVSIRVEIRCRARESGEDLVDNTYIETETYDVADGRDEGARAAALLALGVIADAVFAAATPDW